MSLMLRLLRFRTGFSLVGQIAFHHHYEFGASKPRPQRRTSEVVPFYLRCQYIRASIRELNGFTLLRECVTPSPLISVPQTETGINVNLL